jgi:hypothetical protein
VLVQVCATLRNLAIKPMHHRQFVAFGAIRALTHVSSQYSSHQELLLNVSRIFSKLSLHSAPCEELGTDEHIRPMAAALKQHMDVPQLVLRFTFVLGNLTAKHDSRRVLFMYDCEGASLLPEMLRHYYAKDVACQRAGDEAGAKEACEVLVKLVRLLANVSIAPSIGTMCAATSAIVSPLLDLLGSKTLASHEELVLNVVAAVTNLLFFDLPANILFHDENKELLCRLLRPLLLENYNPEALVETARALGNLSRHADARLFMSRLRIDEVLVILLEHTNRDLVYYLSGVLVNLAADAECNRRLVQLKVVPKLCELLEDASDDAELLLSATGQ